MRLLKNKVFWDKSIYFIYLSIYLSIYLFLYIFDNKDDSVGNIHYLAL